MTPPPSRRSVLRACGLALCGGLAGCVSEVAPGGTDSPTDAATPTHTTVSCAEQDSVDDITVWNGLSSAHAVRVTVTNTRDGTESVVFERLYDVGAGEYEGTQVVFDGDIAGTYTLTAEADNGWSNAQDVTHVAENAFRYGITVELNAPEEALFIDTTHSDPGPNHQTGCER